MGVSGCTYHWFKEVIVEKMQPVMKWGKKANLYLLTNAPPFSECSTVEGRQMAHAWGWEWMYFHPRNPELQRKINRQLMRPFWSCKLQIILPTWQWKMTLWGVMTTSKLLDAPYGMEPIVPSDCSTYCVVCNALFTYLQQSHGRCPSHKCSVETPAWIPIQHSTVSLSLLIQRFEGLNGKSLCLEQLWAGKISIINAFEKEQ